MFYFGGNRVGRLPSFTLAFLSGLMQVWYKVNEAAQGGTDSLSVCLSPPVALSQICRWDQSPGPDTAPQSPAAELALFNVLLGKEGRERAPCFLTRTRNTIHLTNVMEYRRCSWCCNFYSLTCIREGDTEVMGLGGT